MKFQDLPTEVQIIAAQSLASKIAEQGALPCNENDLNQCSAAIANAFFCLYSPQQPVQFQNDNIRAEPQGAGCSGKNTAFSKMELERRNSEAAKISMDSGAFHISQIIDAAEIARISISDYLHKENASLFNREKRNCIRAALQMALKLID